MGRGAMQPWGRKELDTTERLHFTSLLISDKQIEKFHYTEMINQKVKYQNPKSVST